MAEHPNDNALFSDPSAQAAAPAESAEQAPRPEAALSERERDELLAPTGDPIFETLWENVVARWDEDKPHAAFLEYAISAKHMPDAAGRYRAMKFDPAKRAVAEKKIQAVIVAATFMLEEMRTKDPEKKNRVLTFVGFFVSLLLLGWLASIVFRH